MLTLTSIESLMAMGRPHRGVMSSPAFALASIASASARACKRSTHRCISGDIKILASDSAGNRLAVAISPRHRVMLQGSMLISIVEGVTGWHWLVNVKVCLV